MEPNKQQKKRHDQTIVDCAVCAIAGMALLVLVLAGVIGTACAADGFDVRSLDAQTAVLPNLTVLGDPFALNVSDRVHEEHEHEKSLIGIRADVDLTRDFDLMRERGNMPPDEYHRMYGIAESGGAGHLFDVPPDEYRRMHEDSGDYGEIEHDKNMDWRTEGSSVISAGDEPVSNTLASTSAYTPTATEEFSGEVVRLTGAQTADIVWDKDNFGGFYYDMDGGVGTETLTIAAGTLTGPNVDRTIETGALSYNTYPFWREYELHKNLGLTAAESGGGDAGYWVEFWMGERYVAINGNASKLAKPLVEFNGTDTKTLVTGEPWDLGGGFCLIAKQIDLEGKRVWLSLEKDGKEVESSILDTGGSDLQERVFAYLKDVAGEEDVPVLSCYVSAVFRGTDTNLVRVKYVFLIDDDILQISTGEYYGNMQATSITPTQVTLGNWKDLYLYQYTQGATYQLMGNLTFKTVNNARAIEFYPHLIRNELPVLSGGGGFASDHCGWYSWNLYENYTIGWNQVDLEGTKAWIVLCKDGVVVDEGILTEEWWAPVDSDSRYSYTRDGTEIVAATLKAAFRGCNLNMIELGEVYQRSEVDCSILIKNESRLLPTATEPSGISWNLSGGYMLTVPDLGLDGDEVRLQLSQDGVVVKEKILNEDYANTFTHTSGVGGVNCVVDRVFRGCDANAVKLVNVNQYSDASGAALIVDGSYFYKSGDPDGMPWELMDGYVLTMKDIDLNGDKVWLELLKDGVVLKEDILESGDLFEYRNGLESFDCVVESVFNGCLAGVVKLKNVNQYSSTGTPLINNESKTYATADPTEAALATAWELHESYSLAPMDIDLMGDKVWLSLFEDGVSVKDAIINPMNNWFKYYNATGALVFSTYVSAVFRGTDTNIVQVRYTTQYSEVDGRLFIEPDAESWQLQEGYYLTAQETYSNNSVWLQLSKNDKLVDEGLFYNSFYLQNDTTGHTIVSGTISSYNHRDDYIQLTSVTQYREAIGTVLATYTSATLYASWSIRNGKKTLSTPTRIPRTLTVDDSGGADYTSIQAAIDASGSGDMIIVYNGTYHENVKVNKQLTLIGIGMPVVDGGWDDCTIRVTANYCTIDGFRVIHGRSYYWNDAGISVSSYGNAIRNNSIHDNGVGIHLNGADSSTLTNNTVSDNSCGIRMYYSSNSTLRDNEIDYNTYNLDVSAGSPDGYAHDIDTSNTVNGKPVYYLVGKSGMVIGSSSNAGYVGVVNS
ncbi:MAG: S-layer protein domain-containing protein, partial [Euryarchaeota archaeon]|nr:S-layer protein domain-containing protein [Euryarchaeota archaeon]